MTDQLILFEEYIKTNHLGKVEKDLSFKELTTLKIGGKIICCYFPNHLDSLYQSIKYLLEQNIPFVVIGRGTNILASDEVFTKVVIKLDELHNIIQLSKDKFLVEAGVIGSKFAFEMAKNGYTKMEFLSTIPGSIGGLIYMNAGAYGTDMKSIVEEVTYIDQSGKIKTLKKDELEFGYRTSIFQKEPTIIVNAILKLHKVENERLPLELIRTYKEKRRKEQPIHQNTAGSTFKNSNQMKAWELIDSLGLRGYSIHDASVSMKHTNFLINQNNATYQDMRALIEEIKKQVKEKYNIDLICEWVILE